MRPTAGDVHVNRPLTNMSLDLFQSMTSFVANQVFPVVGSDQKSNVYYKFDQTYFNRDNLKQRAPGTEAELIEYGLSTDSFECLSWDGKVPIHDQIRQNADSQVQLDLQASRLAMIQARIRAERLWAATFFTSGVWTGWDYAGVAGSPSTSQFKQWDQSDSTPVEDVEDARINMMKTVGIRPNVMVVGAEVHSKLKNNAQIIARINQGQTPGGPAMVTKQQLAALFEVDRYLVMEAIYETAQEGATSAPAFIAGKKALLCYAAPAPGLLTPSAGYTFAWTGRVGATSEGFRVKKYREEPKEADMVEVQLGIVHKLTAVELGAFFDTAVA